MHEEISLQLRLIVKRGAALGAALAGFTSPVPAAPPLTTPAAQPAFRAEQFTDFVGINGSPLQLLCHPRRAVQRRRQDL